MDVKSKRRYDSSRRRERAQRTRGTILDVARAELLDNGYAATTVTRIAGLAGTSVETIYKGFGGKAGLVRALWKQALAGQQEIPAEQRSDALSSTTDDPVAVLKGWGRFASELSPRGAPIVLLMRAAAATDPEMAGLLAEAEAQRRRRMRHNARRLQHQGWLRPGIGLKFATDVLWTYSSAELYDLLVVRSRWSARRYGDFIGDSMVAALL
jgi:AcrR family transcriptional regulator